MSNAESKTLSIVDLDLTSAAAEGHEFEVVSPRTGKGLGVFITVLGDQSDKVVAFTHKHMNAKRREAALAMQRGRTQNDIETVEEDEAYLVEACIVRTIGWRGLTEEFSEANARLLFTKNREIRRQVLKESGDLANFTNV